MSDFHLQQLASASAAVPEDQTTVETTAVQNTVHRQESQEIQESDLMSCLDSDPRNVAQTHVEVENATAPVESDGLYAQLPSVVTTIAPDADLQYIFPQLRQMVNIPMIPPPHPAHAPPISHSHAPTSVTHLDRTSQFGDATMALMPPIAQPASVSLPRTGGTTQDTPMTTALTLQAAAAPPPLHPMVPVMEHNVDVETKYQLKCNECAALRMELADKNSRIRALEQERYRRNNNININNINSNNNINNNNISNNTTGRDSNVTNVSHHHEQHGSGSGSHTNASSMVTATANATSIMSVQGENNNNNQHNHNSNVTDTTTASNITIDVDIGPSSSRTRSYDQRWKARFQDLVKYKLAHGNCVVPKSYKDKGLHSWVRKQRILKKEFDLGLASDESMTQERVNALSSVGFAWVVGHQSNDSQWETNFQQLVVFKSQYGHSRVPQSYDKTLHKWVLNQRCRRRLLEEKGEGKAKGMTWARIEKLDAIDFLWSGKK